MIFIDANIMISTLCSLFSVYGSPGSVISTGWLCNHAEQSFDLMALIKSLPMLLQISCHVQPATDIVGWRHTLASCMHNPYGLRNREERWLTRPCYFCSIA